MFIFSFETIVKDIKKYIFKEKKIIQTPPTSPDITSIMRRNKSNDDFNKIHLPWIL